jgi:PilZ domain
MAEVAMQTSDHLDRRSVDRQPMILRVGVLEQEGNASFCLVGNISPFGIHVKLYTARLQPGAVIIRIADERPISGKVVWIEAGNAGVSFDGELDTSTLLRLQQKLTPTRRRAMPRVKATSYAALRIDKRIIQAVLQDISSMGARVTTSRRLEVGAAASIRFPDLPELRTSVRWTENSDSGLVFETPIPMEVIGHWIDGRLRPGPA